MDQAVKRIREVLPDVCETFVRTWLRQYGDGDFETESQNLLTHCLEAQDYPRDKVERKHRSAEEEADAMCLSTLQAEVDELWAAELRGDPAPDLQSNAQKSLEYRLHAVHTLLARFPKVPVADVRKAFLTAGSFTAAAKHLGEHSGHKELVSGRKAARAARTVPPCPVPRELVREIAFGEAIAAALEQRRKTCDEKRKDGTGLYTCGICFDDTVLPDEVLFCSGDCNGEGIHPFCFSCVKNHTLTTFGSGLFAQNFLAAARASSNHEASSSSSASSSKALPQATFDTKLTVVRCPDMSGCTGCFSEHVLRMGLPPKEYRRYTTRSAALNAINSGLQDLAPCPACDFLVQMQSKDDAVLRCLNPDCGKVSCRWCGEDDHPGLTCEQIGNRETKLRRYMEEQMTDISMRRCPNSSCRKAYERTEGCNKMTCPCGTSFCYLCGVEIDKARPYDHFKDGSKGGGTNAEKSQCVVFGIPDWAKASDTSRKRKAETALQEYLEAHPELQDLGGDRIVKTVKEQLGWVAEVPTPARKQPRLNAAANVDVAVVAPRVAPKRAAAPKRAPAHRGNHAGGVGGWVAQVVNRVGAGQCCVM